MRNFFVRSNSNSCFSYWWNYNYAAVNGLQRFQSLREQFQGASFSSSLNVGIATSEGIRRQLLDTATTELQRVKRYYESEEFKSNANATTTGSTHISVQHHNHNQRVVAAPTILETSADVQTYLDDIDTVMFDCDGVLYRSPHPTPDVSKAILQLLRPPLEQQQKLKQVLFVTNNGSVSRSQLQQKISSFLSLPNDLLNDDMMISSAYACSQYLRTQKPQPQHIFCIGSEGTCNELIEAGFNVTHGNSETVSSMSRDDLAAYDFSSLLPQQHDNNSSRQNISSPSLQSLENYPKIDAVVIGHDTNFTYRKLCLATVLLQQNPTAVLVATNMDSYDITGIHRRHIPGNGALVKAVEYASHRTAVDVGKPSRTLFDLIQSKVKLDVKRTAFVGDRLDTDIRFGIDHGMKSILVMTGVTNVTELRRIHTGTIEEPLPTAIMSHVGLMARS